MRAALAGTRLLAFQRLLAAGICLTLASLGCAHTGSDRAHALKAAAFERCRTSQSHDNCQLKAAGEEMLFAAGDGAEAYRFTWLRSFHHPIFVRIEKKAGHAFIVGKELDGAGGYSPGVILHERRAELTEGEWSELIAAIERSGLWTQHPPEPKTFGFDGASWTLEGLRNGRYRVVSLWTMDVLFREGGAGRADPCGRSPNPGFCAAALGMVRLSGLDVPAGHELY